MGVTKEEVEATLTSKLNPTHLSDDGPPRGLNDLGYGWFILGAKPNFGYHIHDRVKLPDYCGEIKPKEVIDTSGGCGASFAIEVVSEQFEGKRLLERHRLVNAALVEQMKEIHALSIKKAVTPAQWQQQEDSNKTKPASE